MTDRAEADVEGEPVVGELPGGPGLVEMLGRWRTDPAAPLVVLGAAVVVWVFVMGRLILLRQHRIATFGFDEGIYDQYLWQLAHFRFENTVRGVPLHGHHASFAFLLFMPLVWLGGGVGTWDALQTVTLASVAFPLFFLARDKLQRPWLACGAGLVWLGQPTVQWFVHEGFHPEVMALPFLVGTYLYGERFLHEQAVGADVRRSRTLFAACFVGTISWKEDLALALVGMGLVWLVRRHWRFAGKVIGAAALWFVLFGVILVPHFAGGSVYGGIYDLGNTPGEIISNSAQHPSRLVHKLDENDAAGNVRDLTRPYGFVPLLSPTTLLIGAPQWFTNIISASAFTWDLRFHYQAVPMAALALGFVDGVAFLHRRRRWFGEAAVVVGLVCALGASHLLGPSPYSVKYRTGIWPLQPAANLGWRYAAMDRLPPGAGTSADYLMVPQLTHRQVIYTFPNPWRSSYYGVGPGKTGDPRKVSWILLDEGLLNDEDRALLASIRASGEFETVLDEQGVVLLHRTAPPGGGTAPIDPGN